MKDVIILSQYIITDGRRFIYRNFSGKYVPTPSEMMADIYTKKQAESIYCHQLPKALKSVFHVEKYDKPMEGTKQVTQSDIDHTEKLKCSDNIKKWINKVSDLNGLVNDASHRKDDLTKQLSNIDKEMCDLMHYIEFCNLSASQGYTVYKMIKDRRIKRRSIKNELEVVTVILNKKLSDSIIDEIIKTIKSLDSRTYEPRVIKELFDI